MVEILSENPIRDINDPSLMTSADLLWVECAEIWDESLGHPDLQLLTGFGLTTLGGLTSQLGQAKINEIVKFNYIVEEKNEVGLSQPLNLVITPRRFLIDILTNNFNDNTLKYIDDIIKANEEHQKRSLIYFNFSHRFLPGRGNKVAHHNLSKLIASCIKLGMIINSKELHYTRKIYFAI